MNVKVKVGEIRKLLPYMTAIIVLGARLDFNERTKQYIPSPLLQNRLDKAIETFYGLNRGDILIVVSGGPAKGGEVTEAAIMERYLIKKGIRPIRIYKEDKSRNTVENCLGTRNLLNKLCKQHILKQELISSNYKCPYYGVDQADCGEIESFDELYVVTSDFHIPRTKYIFETIIGPHMNMHFISAPTPADVAPHYIQRESLINVDKMLSRYRA